jgi:transcriptional regulator with XRE-family HTH domain
MHVDEAPSSVDSAGWNSSLGTALEVGDLWLLSWDQEALGLAVIAGIAPTFVLVWPVGLPDDEAFPPAIEVPSSHLSAGLSVWPTRETGVGIHLLDRCFGRLMSPRAMALTAEAAEDPVAEPPYPLVDVRPPGLEIEEASDRLVDRWESICFHTWPRVEAGNSPLSVARLRKAGLSLEDVAVALGLDTPDAVALFRGERFPTEDVVRVLAERASVEVEELLDVPEVVQIMATPVFKHEVMMLAQRLGIDELRARELVRGDLALAARSEGRLDVLVRAAIDRVAQRANDD